MAAVYDPLLEVTIDFVANEIVVVTDDEAELDAILEELGAEELGTFDPDVLGLPEHPSEHLLRVDPSGTETSDLASLLASLEEDTEGRFAVSSQAGLELLALAAQLRTRGHDVS